MESKIISQTKNPFLHREEYVVEMKSDVNPSFDDVKKSLGKDGDLTVVKKIRGNFGRHRFNADVFVYDNKDMMKRIEKIKKKEGEAEEKVEKIKEEPVEPSKEDDGDDTKLPKAEKKEEMSEPKGEPKLPEAQEPKQENKTAEEK